MISLRSKSLRAERVNRCGAIESGIVVVVVCRIVIGVACIVVGIHLVVVQTVGTGGGASWGADVLGSVFIGLGTLDKRFGTLNGSE